jgi:TfoX/Sxy family transcriptional regulator of competence genes
MFGGVCFMVDDKMCFGPGPMGMMMRIDPDEEAELLQRAGVSQMKHGNRTMKGYLALDEETMDSDEELDFWIGKTLEFNPKAKSSKKKKS